MIMFFFRIQFLVYLDDFMNAFLMLYRVIIYKFALAGTGRTVFLQFNPNFLCTDSVQCFFSLILLRFWINRCRQNQRMGSQRLTQRIDF